MILFEDSGLWNIKHKCIQCEIHMETGGRKKRRVDNVKLQKQIEWISFVVAEATYFWVYA